MTTEEERDQAREIVREIWWMARRYADRRNTFAPHMFNEAIKQALPWLGDDDKGEIYAKDPIDGSNPPKPSQLSKQAI